MPAHFPSKLFRFSVELLYRQRHSGLFQSHSFSSLVDCIRAFSSNDRPTAESIVGTFYRMISVPSLTGASWYSCIHNVGRLVSESTRSSSCVLFERNMAFSCNSLPGGAEWVTHHQNRKMLGSFLSFDAYFSHGNFDYCSRSCKTLRIQELSNSTAVYRHIWSSAIGESFNLFSPNGIKVLSSSFFTSFSTGAASDMSLGGSPQEEQLDNSSSSSDSDQKKPSNRALKLLSGSCYLPHPDKEETGGEDAHFIWDEQAIGVADGVGGWADHGVDAGQYSRALMSHASDAIEEESKGSIDPLRVLEKAYLRTKAQGSSTACIIALTDQVFTFPVESGDVIVAGTDGLFDNLYNSEITAVVVHGIRAGLGPQVMAQKIAALARQRAQDKNRQTPFSTSAQEAGYRYYGGKLDDITVVVSYITAFGN
ncbi:probable protein phosphatase 2C 55 isoform X2 [Musa acuminata AAA Group]|uniref:probable protein phosphatase 2C 55 isoform X2 n=1 Tax=Musa acuminata AAA Group TaxID=214697 RepID=UPI0031D5B933